MAKLLAISANRKRLERIKIALQNIVDDLDDGRRRKHGFFCDTREERVLAEFAAIWDDLELLEIQ